MTAVQKRRFDRTVIGLGLAQTVAWGSTYYMPAVLAMPMAQALGVASSIIFSGLSFALIIAALVGPLAGRLIDQHGGRMVLATSNLVAAVGLLLLAVAPGMGWFFAAWALIGLAMGTGLYEAAFATVVRLHGRAARGPITGITLIAGFASTVAWPLTA